MQKAKVAIVGFGNVGKEVMEAVLDSLDMEVAGIVEVPDRVHLFQGKAYDFPVVSDVKELGKVDVAILAAGSRCVPQIAPYYLEKGINTVDAFDIHGESIIKLKKELTSIAKSYGAVAIISAGWDPGTNSVMRVIMEAIAPRGMTYTNYGPGMSMGHTVAVKAIEGIDNAISLTIPKGVGMHKRLVYVSLKKGYDLENVSCKIKKDPYFINDEVHVFEVNNIGDLIDMGHAVKIERKGVSGKSHNQRMEYTLSVDNPAVTGQVLVAAARASIKQKPGCYSVLEIPLIDFLYGEKKELLSRLI